MEHKLLILGTALLLLSSSCKSPSYLPKVEEIGINEFGSFITVDLSDKSVIEGELIAMDNENLIVITRQKDINQLLTIPIADIKTFRLQYAQAKNYGWTIPGSTLVSLSHGYLAVFTTPLNIAVTAVVTTRGTRAYTYNKKTISWEDLKMFARFPQGIPPNIEIANLK